MTVRADLCRDELDAWDMAQAESDDARRDAAADERDSE
jgi:hypothetical protein